MAGLGTITQEPQSNPVEGACLDGVTQFEPAKPSLELSGGIAREREGENVAWRGVTGRNAMGDASGEDQGLAGPGGGDHSQRGGLGDHGLVLGGVEAGKEAISGHGRHDRARVSQSCLGVAERGTTVRSMPFPKKNLNANETIALDMHPHWWYFAEPAMLLLGVIVLGIIVAIKGPDGDAGDALKWVVIALLVITALWLIGRYLKWITTNFVITSHRLIFRQGVIAKSGVEIPLERVNNVNFNQTIFERVLGAGDLLIESGGEDGQQRFTDIRHPDKVQNLIHAQMEILHQRRGGYSAPRSAGVDVAEQLERLEGLLERGTITREEFDSQKDKLLGS